ncbi:MAG: ATP-binding protein [Candidatus Muiribacteriota bacterium]
MYIERKITNRLLKLSKSFPALAIVGPRQSGKTTLAKKTFPEADYYSMEVPDTRALISSDPRAFFNNHKNTVILDEIQKTPELFSYLQEFIDKENKPGRFILTGSQNFSMYEKITQSLAGRMYISKLLPFSFDEIKNKYSDKDYHNLLLKGFYPRLYSTDMDFSDFYPAYIETYIERDVRQIKNIKDLSTFSKFLQIAAGHVGQLVNFSEIGNQVGVSHNTVREWFSILEASYILFFLKPFYKNLNKRLVKQPKLYFYDTGLLCNLLSISNSDQLFSHYNKGGIFESFVVSEFLKRKFNNGSLEQFSFYRDNRGYEIDLIIEDGGKMNGIEIKSSSTFNKAFLKNLKYIEKTQNGLMGKYSLVYGGDIKSNMNNVEIIPWREI